MAMNRVILSKDDNFDIETEEGKKNIDLVIKEYHKKLNAVYPIDVVMSGIAGAATASILYSWTAPFILILADVAIKTFIRNNREQPYQEQLDLLIHIYKNLLKQYGARVTNNDRFLEIMDILRFCLPSNSIQDSENTANILFPLKLNTHEEFPHLSSTFIYMLETSPLHLKVIGPPPLAPSTLSSVAHFFVGKEQHVDSKKKVSPEKTSEAWGRHMITDHLWCKFYGYNPARLNAKPVKSISEELKDVAMNVVSIARR